jgi:hypothetical protein
MLGKCKKCKKLVDPVVNREAIGVGKIFWYPEPAGE